MSNTEEEMKILREAGIAEENMDDYQVIDGKVYCRCGCGY